MRIALEVTAEAILISFAMVCIAGAIIGVWG
jgi:hypothetical protein